MKIFYIAHARLPTEKAHGIQIMEMCRAFTELHHKVTLIVPFRRNTISESPFTFYGIPQDFEIVTLPVVDLIFLGKIGHLLSWLMFSGMVFLYTLSHKADLLYSRDELSLAFLALLNRNLAWEGHTGQWSMAVRFLAAVQVPFIVITQGLKDFYVKRGVSKKKIFVAHDGVNLSSFEQSFDRQKVRDSFGITDGEFLVAYTGKLSGWKGVPTLCESFGFLSNKNYRLLIAGGEGSETEVLKKKYPSIQFLGRLSRVRAIELQRASDLLVIPNTAQSIISKSFTSPLKLFEYMASGVPIIASDLPSLREIISEGEVTFAVPDSAISLSTGIEFIKEHHEDARTKALRAKEKVAEYSWINRTRSIIASLYAESS